MTDDPVLIERTFAVDAGGRCRLRVPRAHVTLEAAAPDGEAHVTLTPSEDAVPAAAQAFADTLDVRHTDGVVRAETDGPPRPDARDWRALRDRPPLLNLHVRLPPRFEADVHASSGSIDARGLDGPVTLEAAGSSIRATGLGGRLDVQAHRCRTTIDDFTGTTCTASVHGGRFTVRDAAAETVEVESRAARLRLDEIDAALHLTAHQGAADVTGPRGPLDADVYGGQCQITPSSGHAVRLHAPGSDARLRLPGALAADLQLSADRLDWNAPNGFDGEREPRRIEGRLNGSGDGAMIEAHVPGGALRCESA
jgi:hypothetical protein